MQGENISTTQQQQTETPPNLLRIRIKNFMGISNVEIKPNQINQIVGDNNQGKTTILKAIEFLFKGSTNGGLVKHGEDQAECFAELPDHTTINRKLKPSGDQSVVVKDKDDFKIGSPQGYLDALVDYSGFNPLDCLEPKKRTEAILKAIDLKVTPEIIASRIGVKVEDLPNFDYNKHGLKVIDEAYNYYDKRRTEANRDALTKHNKWKSYEADFKPQLPPENTRESVAAERAKLNERLVTAKIEIGNIEKIEQENAKTTETVARYEAELVKIQKETMDFTDSAEVEIEVLQAKINKLRAEITSKTELATQRIADGQKFIEETKATLKSVPDKTAYENELRDCAEQSALLNAADKELDAFDALKQQEKMIKDLENEWRVEQDRAEQIEFQAKQLQHKFKKELMATVEMPLAGLEYVDGQFLVHATPIDQLSSSLAMKLAINIARKLHKKNKIILADGVERLDDKVRAEFFEEIKNDGFTYFFANVGDGDPNYPRITISKGMVQ